MVILICGYQILQNGQVMKRGVDHIAILILVSRLSLLALLPYWFYEEGVDIIFGETLGRLGDQVHVNSSV